MFKNFSRLLVAIAWCLPLVPSVHAAQFYEGKSIKLIVGFSAGGGFDTYSRLIARHLGRHIPGNPSPVKLGGVAPGDTTYNTAKLLIAALKLPIQLVAGYKGTAEVRLAAEAGEVTGGCWQWESIKSIWRQGLDSGNVFIVLQVNAKPHPELAKVANAIDYAPNENSKLLLKFGGHDPAAITRPYALAPGTPKDRAQLLRTAFVEALKDPEFMADAKKSRLDTDPLTGEEIEKIVLQLFKMDATLVSQLKEILK